MCYFDFVAFDFGVKSKKTTAETNVRECPPAIFSSESFMASGITFKFLIHFELILGVV